VKRPNGLFDCDCMRVSKRTFTGYFYTIYLSLDVQSVHCIKMCINFLYIETLSVNDVLSAEFIHRVQTGHF